MVCDALWEYDETGDAERSFDFTFASKLVRSPPPLLLPPSTGIPVRRVSSIRSTTNYTSNTT